MNNNIERLLASGKLKCPACSGLLNLDNILICVNCKQGFPVFDNLPVLAPKPEEFIKVWKNRMTGFINRQMRNIQSSKQLIASTTLYPPFRDRLKNMTQARVENLQTIMELMRPLKEIDPDAPPENLNDLTGFKTMVYLLRDWAWDTDEVDIMCNKVIELLPEDLQLTSMLVLGAGGCRASYNLHNHYNCPLTVSVDYSPFMLLAASRVIEGRRLGLHQILPNNIRNAQDNLSFWNLRAPRKPDNDFLLMLADAKELPVEDKSFRVVLTPFIIDEISEDLRSFAPKVNRLLETGGYWVNYGAMTFLPEIGYTADEVLSIVKNSGFHIVDYGFSTQAHAAPRETCLRQVYDCLYFLAIKE